MGRISMRAGPGGGPAWIPTSPHKDLPMRALHVLIMALALVTLTGFAKLNTEPPFIDPANPVPHATVSPLPPEDGYEPILFGVDGSYPKYKLTLLGMRRSSGERVLEMKVLPGPRRIMLKCSKRGSALQANIELVLHLEADKHYRVGCRLGRTIEYGRILKKKLDYVEFVIVDRDGNPVPFNTREVHGEF